MRILLLIAAILLTSCDLSVAVPQGKDEPTPTPTAVPMPQPAANVSVVEGSLTTFDRNMIVLNFITSMCLFNGTANTDCLKVAFKCSTALKVDMPDVTNKTIECAKEGRKEFHE